MHSVHPSASTLPTDIGGVIVVHSMFRREVGVAGDLVRRVEPGDTRRSGLVARHLDLIDRCLHHHHVIEDELVWPLAVGSGVERRGADRRADGVATRRGRDPARPDRAAARPMGRTADASGRDELAALYERLAVALVDHLDDEENPRAADRGGVPQPVGMGLARRRRTARHASIGTTSVFGSCSTTAICASSPPCRIGAEAVRVLLPWLARRRSADIPWPSTARPRRDRAARRCRPPDVSACPFWRKAERRVRRGRLLARPRRRGPTPR